VLLGLLTTHHAGQDSALQLSWRSPQAYYTQHVAAHVAGSVTDLASCANGVLALARAVEEGGGRALQAAVDAAAIEV
jgi:hypothetical protein